MLPDSPVPQTTTVQLGQNIFEGTFNNLNYLVIFGLITTSMTKIPLLIAYLEVAYVYKQNLFQADKIKACYNLYLVNFVEANL
mgnify:CR=1 FL=1